MPGTNDEKNLTEFQKTPSVLQIAHGKIIPNYSSAYSIRCHTLINNLNRKLISTAGAIFRDEKDAYSEQYRSILLTVWSFIKGSRSLEIYISQGKYLRKRYVKRLKELVVASDIIIFEGPWQHPLVKDLLDNKLIIYDAHNVEYLLRRGNKYAEDCKKIEGDLLKCSFLILSVAKKDITNFVEIYGTELSKFRHAPLGISVPRKQWEGKLSNSIVFIGSLYSPNNDALNRIIELADHYPAFTFEIIGSVRPTKGSKLKNIVYHGVVDENRKDEIMSRCFLALNPVTEGSGRNLKMVDYLAHGLPVMSTPIGVRGFEDFSITDSIIVSELGQFGSKIEKLSEDREMVEQMSKNSRVLYEKISKTENAIDPDEIIMQAFYDFKNLQSRTGTSAENKRR
jgi:hypothetical protein